MPFSSSLPNKCISLETIQEIMCPPGLSSASLSSPFAPNPADLGGLASYINIPASQEQASLKRKESSQWDTPSPIHPTPPPTQLGPQLPTKQLWPLVGCGCIGCCHGDRGTLLSHTHRSSTEWVSPAWETQRIHQRLLLMQPLMLPHTTSWISERASFPLSIQPTPGTTLSFLYWLGVEGNPLPLILLQFLFKEPPARW